MYDKSERAYSWIEAKSARLGKWIDSNLARLMIIVVFTGLAIWGFLLEEQENLSMGQRLVRSLGPSLAGIVIAAVTIEVLAERRMEQERKAQLIRQLGSKYRDVTEMAIIELRHKGWLEDGSLSGTQLMEADLSGANLLGAILSQANLRGANLSGARLMEADLSGADLTAANMSGASLLAVNLSRADLCGVDLSDTNLQRAELSGASLKQANLSEAYFWTIEQLQETKTLEAATMPDGVMLRREEAVLEVAPNVAFQLSRTDGPTFEVWKAEYLRKYGGTVRDIRSRFESDYELRS
jgi:hypothetical protein